MLLSTSQLNPVFSTFKSTTPLTLSSPLSFASYIVPELYDKFIVIIFAIVSLVSFIVIGINGTINFTSLLALKLPSFAVIVNVALRLSFSVLKFNILPEILSLMSIASETLKVSVSLSSSVKYSERFIVVVPLIVKASIPEFQTGALFGCIIGSGLMT
ncbi:hypothetical protein HYX00_05385 [Candidatus Woesearchaeota archaeon]|nr:hypothetical protein [Candidatus Woesearchaeota archaeon]